MSEILFALGLVSSLANVACAILGLWREYMQYKRIASDK